MKVWSDLPSFSDSQNYIHNPIFLVGPPRCGTTLTYNTLIIHRDLCWFSAKDNLKIFHPDYVESQRKEIVSIREQGKRGGDGEFNILFYGEKDSVNSPAWTHFSDRTNLPIEGVHISNRFFGTDFDVDVNSTSKLFKDFLNTICKEKKKSRFTNKNPQNLKRVRALNELFPDSIFVCILRNPFAVIRSMRMLIEKRLGNNFYLELPTIGHNIETTDKIEYAALNLKQNIDMVFEFKEKYPEKFYIFFYEDLVKDPINEFKKLLKFCNLEEYDDFFKSLPKIIDMNVDWEQFFSSSEIETISNILSDTMKKHNLPYIFENMKQ